MIRVIREDGIEILLNTNSVQKVRSGGFRRSVITLSNGESFAVKTTAFDVLEKIKAYQTGIREERREYEKALEKAEKEREKVASKEEKDRIEKELAAKEKLAAALEGTPEIEVTGNIADEPTTPQPETGNINPNEEEDEEDEEDETENEEEADEEEDEDDEDEEE
jgi:uncharacterized protein YlzI (FlbEa/FlbD family)